MGIISDLNKTGIEDFADEARNQNAYLRNAGARGYLPPDSQERSWWASSLIAVALFVVLIGTVTIAAIHERDRDVTVAGQVIAKSELPKTIQVKPEKRK